MNAGELCSCGRSLSDGEGWDGLCGECADRKTNGAASATPGLFGDITATRPTEGHRRQQGGTDVWLTPPAILAALGPFDLDPCAAPEPRPWATAARHIALPEDGLRAHWAGRVWCNPPYSDTAPWLAKLADHGHGTALIFARTETVTFQRHVWGRASALLFLAGRLTFHRHTGQAGRANAGAPSVLIAYGDADAEVLRSCGLAGAFVAGVALVGAGL